VILHLPLPPIALSPNGRTPWILKHKAMKSSADHVTLAIALDKPKKSACIELAKAALSGRKLYLVVDAFPAHPGCTQKGQCCPDDDDNGAAACKGFRDAIAAYIGIDDKHIRTIWNKHKNPKGETVTCKGHTIRPVGGCVVELTETMQSA